MRALFVVLLLTLAGCTTPPDDAPADGFDGDAAYAFVAGLVTDADGPRYRTPGTPGHAAAADWLEAAMDVPGWSVSRQTFNGSDYLGLDKGEVEGYQGAWYCQEPDRTELEDLTFHNLVATRGPTDPMVWLGAHWESKEEASEDPHASGAPMLGANDGASGVGVLLQLMRELPELDFGVGIVFFDGEDGFEDCHALAGSLYFARTMEPGLVDRFVLLDMVGDPDARFVREGRSEDADPALVDLLWEHGASYWPSAFTDRRRSVTDDHVPFLEEGVPAVDLIDFGREGGRYGFPPYWHSTGDTLEHIDAAMLGAVGDTLVATLTDARFSADWP